MTMPGGHAVVALNSDVKRDEHGRFIVPPKSPGRPKGARTKLGEAFFEALYDDFKEHGVAAIVKVRDEKPDQYIRTVAAVMPKEIEAGERLSSVLEEILERVDGRTREITPLKLVANG